MSSSSRRPPPRQVPSPSNSTAASSPHTRFIPREELTDYSSWVPGSLADDDAASGHPRRWPERPLDSPVWPGLPTFDGSQGSPRQGGGEHHGFLASTSGSVSPPTGEPEPGQDLEALQQTARQAGYHDGYRDGLAALESFKRSVAQQMSTQIGQLLQSIDQEFTSLEADMAQAVVKAATGLARQIVRSELITRPELVNTVARLAVAAVSSSVRRMEMRVHPDDLALVQTGLGEEAQSRGVYCVPDPEIARGGCRLHTEIGSIDARIEHQWEMAMQRIGQDPITWPLQSEDRF